MPLSTATFLLSLWLLAIGLLTVFLEVQNVYCGVRIRELLEREEDTIDSVRRSQLEYHKLVSPDVLERSLPEEFKDEAGFALIDSGDDGQEPESRTDTTDPSYD